MPYRPLTPPRGRPPGPFFVEEQLAETEARQEQDRERAAAEAATRESDSATARESLGSRIRRALGR